MALLTRSELLATDLSFRTKVAAAKALLSESRATPLDAQFDIFLSHSSRHPRQVRAIKARLEAFGYSVYVDWLEDEELARSNVTPKTAARLRHRLKSSRSLLVHASEGANVSRWIPWELGLADGLQLRVAIIPVVTDDRVTDSYRGVEYLGLYPYVDFARSVTNPIVIPWVNRNAVTYVAFKGWLQGREPRPHRP
jgi:hypothetical protein